MAPLRPCLVCRRPTRGARCPAHALPRRGHAHAVAANAAVANALACWRCGKPGTPDDPLTGDHVIARAHGGTDDPSNYRASHRSCNSRAGAAITNGQGVPGGGIPIAESENRFLTPP
jgi:5-methylcytosine-specific restriction endonuclease McrA